MPDKIIGRNASLGVHDSAGACIPISALASTITLSWTADAPEVTGFGETNRQRVSDTMIDWELTFDGFYGYNTDLISVSSIDKLMRNVLGGSTYILFGPAGSDSSISISRPKYTACAICTNYELNVTTEDAATVSCTFVNRSGSMTTASTWYIP